MKKDQDQSKHECYCPHPYERCICEHENGKCCENIKMERILGRPVSEKEGNFSQVEILPEYCSACRQKLPKMKVSSSEPPKKDREEVNLDEPFGEMDCMLCNIRRPTTLREINNHHTECEKIHDAFDRGYIVGRREDEIKRQIEKGKKIPAPSIAEEEGEMTVEEAWKFILIASGPNEWADENSEFHRDNPATFKEMFIGEWLKAQDLLSRQKQREEDAKICEKLIKENDDELMNCSFVSPVRGWLEEAQRKILPTQPE